jgi:hypothetical protein
MLRMSAHASSMEWTQESTLTKGMHINIRKRTSAARRLCWFRSVLSKRRACLRPTGLGQPTSATNA